ncbi:MAG: type II toxin-antitoxin system VapC family toxin [Acidobacteria bacterium]|nr:type II toxin-antitoxin system VapC family toxin [Acidobacteriota bacterium]
MDGFEVVEITHDVITSACSLLCRHRLRTIDAVHIASALLLHERLARPGFEPKIEFIGFDRDLNTAAHAEGLTTLTV